MSVEPKVGRGFWESNDSESENRSERLGEMRGPRGSQDGVFRGAISGWAGRMGRGARVRERGADVRGERSGVPVVRQGLVEVGLREAVLALGLVACAPDLQGPIAVDGGLVSGVHLPDSPVRRYAGIPYAAPPVGDHGSECLARRRTRR